MKGLWYKFLCLLGEHKWCYDNWAATPKGTPRRCLRCGIIG